jgi:iron complex transport system permease protein
VTATRRRLVGVFAGLIVVAAGIALLRVLVDRPPGGPVTLAWPDPAWAMFRYRALATGAIVGAALAISGTLLQALLRNALASPFILGVSSGAGLGVMIRLAVVSLAGGTSVGVSVASTAGPAIVGALATLAVVYALSQRRGWVDPISMVLIGVVVSTICAAGIMFCQHLVPTGVRGEFLLWLMGFIPESTPLPTLAIAGGVTIVALLVATALGRSMDAATLGDDEARSVGLAIGPLRLSMFVVAGVLTAMTVALAGPIGFVGLIAPHAARLLIGPRHGPLVTASVLVGVVLVVGSDVLRQAIDIGAGRMPIGIFTSLVGGPLFIWLLVSRRGGV